MSKARILLIGSEERSLTQLGGILTRLRYEVAGPVRSGEEAIVCGPTMRAEAALVDLLLEGSVTGLKTAEILNRRDGIPAVFYSTRCDPERLARAAAADPCGCAVAPWRKTDLDAHLTLAIGRRRSSPAHLYAALFGAFADAVIVTDCNGRVLYLNPAAEALTGQTQQSSLGEHWTSLGRFDFDDLPAERLVERVASQGQAIPATRATAMFTGTGARRRVEVSAAPLTGRTGGIVGVTVMLRDVSGLERKADHARRARHFEAMRRLASGVAHEFSNDLTVIGGYAELLRQEISADDPARRHLDHIFKASERASDLTRQLLALSQHRYGRPEVLSVNDAASRAAKRLQAEIDSTIDLRLELAPEAGKIKADPSQIEQLILDLGWNARDAMPDGGVLAIETSEVEITSSQARDRTGVLPGHYARIAVSDTGHGMDRETRRHAFEPFFTTRPGATGLGLSAVFGLAMQLGGCVEIHSRPKHGATVEVFLPKLDDAVEAAPAAATRSHRTGETILLVEDESAIRRLAEEVLLRAGYTVLGVESGEEAVAVSEAVAARIDLLLTDILLPGTSGRELARRLMRARPDLRILYMSSFSHYAITRHGGIDSGAPILQKPFSPDLLTVRVREILDSPAVAAV